MKKIILLAILISTAVFYLNKERPDWFLIALTHIPIFNTEVNIDFNHDKDGLSEENIHAKFDHLFLVCANEPSDLGDRVCWTYISRSNGIDAEIIAFFFDQEKYRNLRVSFPDDEHSDLLSYLNTNFKVKTVSKGSKEKFGQDLGVWFCETGTLSAYKENPKQGSLNLLLWSNIENYSKHHLKGV